MAIIRTKDNVPQPYVSESRDFQLFTRILDVAQNATKFNIDSIITTLDTSDMPSAYLERLKSKLGFFTPHHYDDRFLRGILSVFPSLIKYKGSEIGIERCVNTFLNIIGAEKGSRIDIYNEHDVYPYTIRIGVNTEITNTTALKDMLSYVIPTGYFVEIYHYESTKTPALQMISNMQSYVYKMGEVDNYDGENNYIGRKSTLRYMDDNTLNSDNAYDSFNTVQLSTVYEPCEDENDQPTVQNVEPSQEEE